LKILGLDLGTRTLGLSICDKTEFIASFYGTIHFEDSNYQEAIEKLKEIVTKEQIEKFVLGLPKNMNNSLGDAAKRSTNFKKMLEDTFHFEVILQDERLTTVEATNYLISSNMSRKKRKTKVDGLSAVLILQTYLDRKR
jgi:putative Holliday junction resolvase